MTCSCVKLKMSTASFCDERSTSGAACTTGDQPDYETQKNEVKRFEDPALQEGETRYLVGIIWWSKWKKYVGYQRFDKAQIGQEYPGPVCNSCLFKDSQTGALKQPLTKGIDFHSLHESSWQKLTNWYTLEKNSRKIERRVYLQGLYAKHPKVEVYPLELELYIWPNLKDSRRRKFSRLDTVAYVEDCIKQEFGIEGTACEMKLFLSDLTIQHMAQPQTLLIKTQTLQDAGIFHRHNKIALEGNFKQVKLEHTRVTNVPSVPVDNKPTGSDLLIPEKTHGEVARMESKNDGKKLELIDPDDIETNDLIQSRPESPNPLPKTNSEESRLTSVKHEKPSSKSQQKQSSTGHHTAVNRKLKLGRCGLVNLGNTCFMNSALQCMSNTEPLREYFYQSSDGCTCTPYKDHLNRNNPFGMNGAIAEAFGDLMERMWSGKQFSTLPRELKAQIGKFAPIFAGYQQQDSQELMNFLLDGLHEDLNLVENKPYVDLMEDDKTKTDEEIAEESWFKYLQRNQSVIVKLFQGQLMARVNCPLCKNEARICDPFTFLSLPISTKKTTPIEISLVRSKSFTSESSLPVMKYKVVLTSNAKVRELKQELMKMTNISTKQMAIIRVWSNEWSCTYTVYKDEDHIQRQPNTQLFALELHEFDKNQECCVIVCHRETVSQMGQYQCRTFSVPIVMNVSLTSLNRDDLYRAIVKKCVVQSAQTEDGIHNNTDQEHTERVALVSDNQDGGGENVHTKDDISTTNNSHCEDVNKPKSDDDGHSSKVITHIDDKIEDHCDTQGEAETETKTEANGDSFSNVKDKAEGKLPISEDDESDKRPTEDGTTSAVTNIDSIEQTTTGDLDANSSHTNDPAQMTTSVVWPNPVTVEPDIHSDNTAEQAETEAIMSHFPGEDKTTESNSSLRAIESSNRDGGDSSEESVHKMGNGIPQCEDVFDHPKGDADVCLKEEITRTHIDDVEDQDPEQAETEAITSHLPSEDKTTESSSSLRAIIESSNRDDGTTKESTVHIMDDGIPPLTDSQSENIDKSKSNADEETRVTHIDEVEDQSCGIQGKPEEDTEEKNTPSHKDNGDSGLNCIGHQGHITRTEATNVIKDTRMHMAHSCGTSVDKVIESRVITQTVTRKVQEPKLFHNMSISIVNPNGRMDQVPDHELGDRLKSVTRFNQSLIVVCDWENSAKWQCVDPTAEEVEHSSCTEEQTIDGKDIELKDCLKLMSDKSILEDWYCTGECQTIVSVSRTFHLWKLPTILIVHLKRFSCDRFGQRQKLTTFVRYPIKNLELRDYVANPNDSDPVYDLFAVCNHSGTLHGGHYTAYVKTKTADDKENWLIFDDTKVDEIRDENQLVTPAAYVLFYSRCDAPPIDVTRIKESITEEVKELAKKYGSQQGLHVEDNEQNETMKSDEYPDPDLEQDYNMYQNANQPYSEKSDDVWDTNRIEVCGSCMTL